MEAIPPVIIAWDLGLGETEVLAWAYQNPGYEAVLDDRAARNCALSLNLPTRGTIYAALAGSVIRDGPGKLFGGLT